MARRRRPEAATTTVPASAGAAVAGAAGAAASTTRAVSRKRPERRPTARPRAPAASRPTRAPAWLDQLAGDLVDAGSREHYVDAALYDYEYRRRRADVTFYRQIARERLGSQGQGYLLELGAGTGRVTLPLARDGHHVVALDQSSTMLARLRARLASERPAVRPRVSVVEGDLRSFRVRRRFPLVIAAFNVL